MRIPNVAQLREVQAENGWEYLDVIRGAVNYVWGIIRDRTRIMRRVSTALFAQIEEPIS